MKLYNTLSGRAEPFSPQDDTVKMYVCGMTPYAPAHVGHALRSVVFDVLRRYLEFSGHRVKHVENFTDIDDKMIEQAARLGVSTSELAEGNIERYLAEMDALNVLRAHEYPRATREIPRIQEIIVSLVDRGVAYPVDGDVYYRVRQKPDYGKLSHRSLDDMRAGARVEVDEKKHDTMDFALWKAQKPGEPAWDSPGGPGRPGWHIECSAMARAYLGTPLDSHGGGQDLVFPHHENEIAQTESFTQDQPMARFWVHNGLMRLGEDKMSKSLGNLVSVSDALERHSPDALRLFFLSSQYRSPLSYSAESVAAQERAAERLRNAASAAGADRPGPALDAGPHRDRFVAAMDDDLNAPRAIAVLFDLAHDVNRAAEEGGNTSDARATLTDLAGVLGLSLASPATETEEDFFPLLHLLLDTDAELRSVGQAPIADAMRQGLGGVGWDRLLEVTASDEAGTGDMGRDDVAAVIQALVDVRTGLRGAREFVLADRVRSRLAEIGFALEDTPRSTEWKRESS